MKTAVDKGKSFGALLTGLSKDLIRLSLFELKLMQLFEKQKRKQALK